MSERYSRQIVVAGYYGYGNVGDEVILGGILESFRSVDPRLGFVVFSGNPAATRKLHQTEAKHWDDIPGCSDAIKQSDLVLVGGGGLLQDYWGYDPRGYLCGGIGGISEYGRPILLAHAHDVPCLLYGVGVGPLISDPARSAVVSLVGLTTRTYVRDHASQAYLFDLGCDPFSVAVCPDLAYAMVQPEDLLLPSFERAGNARLKVGVVVRNWMHAGDAQCWMDELAAALDRIIAETDADILFIPFQEQVHTLERDQAAAEMVRERMRFQEHARIISATHSVWERFFLAGKVDLLIGMRLHSLVSAMRAGTACIGLAYDPKVRVLMTQAGLQEYVFDLANLANIPLSDMAIDLMHTAAPEHKQAADFAGQAGADCRKTAAEALSWIDNSKTGSTPELLKDVYLLQCDLIAQLQQAQDQLAEEKKMDAIRVPSEYVQKAAMAEAIRHIEACHSLELKRKSELELEIKRKLELKQAEVNCLRNEIQALRSSRGYRILDKTWGILWRIRHPLDTCKELRQRAAAGIGRVDNRLGGIARKLLRRITPFIPPQMALLLWASASEADSATEKASVLLFTDDDEIFPGHEYRRSLTLDAAPQLKVSWVTTVRNEGRHVREWLQQLENQTRRPDEIIILDGGSIDETLSELEAFRAQTSLNLRVYSLSDTNIATRRNHGVRMARHDVIVMTDFGCTLHPQWLQRIMVPFEVDADIEVSAGFYDVSSRTWLGSSAMHELVPWQACVDPLTFLPACRSIGFHKRAWQKVGGFPTWLTKTGEDTYFGLQLKQHCPRWAFVPEALVTWHAPDTIKGIWQKLVSWTRGDGESLSFTCTYRQLLLESAGMVMLLLTMLISMLLYPLSLVPAGIMLGVILLELLYRRWHGKRPAWIWRQFGKIARSVGFIQGVNKRPAALARRYAGCEGVVFMLTGVPIDDTGGGARGTQIALEFLRRGYLVVFVNRFEKHESVDLQLRYDDPNLIMFGLQDLDLKQFYWEYAEVMAENPVIVWLEFPLPEFSDLTLEMKKRGARIIYDLIDDWETSLGGSWYNKNTDQKLIGMADTLIASAPRLSRRLARESGRKVTLMENAVNAGLFSRDQSLLLPADMPAGRRRFIYIGALWGQWFDWQLLLELAGAHPEDAFVIIGDYRGQCPQTLPNLTFLGLKPQTVLPAYLAHSDVGILPWVDSAITQATSPLKVFEYLAMGVPVVAPDLQPLRGLPYTFLGNGLMAFKRNIALAVIQQIEDDRIRAFVDQNSWQARMSTVLPGNGVPRNESEHVVMQIDSVK